MSNEFQFRTPLPRYQAGVLTTFTGVLVLVMLTLMMFFAIRVGVFEQRVSSNEMRQKRAFHAAESGIQHAKEFFRANAVFVASDIPDMLADGTDGWLAAGAERWQPCSGAGLDLTAAARIRALPSRIRPVEPICTTGPSAATPACH